MLQPLIEMENLCQNKKTLLNINEIKISKTSYNASESEMEMKLTPIDPERWKPITKKPLTMVSQWCFSYFVLNKIN